MKRIFMIIALMLTAILTAQTATWTGAKTFGSTLKFLNVLQNDANTRIMSLDATGKPGWVSKSTLSSPINLETESQAQNPFWFYSQNLRVGYSIQIFDNLPIVGFTTHKYFGIEHFSPDGVSPYSGRGGSIYYPRGLFEGPNLLCGTFALSVNGECANATTGDISVDVNLSVYADNAAAIAAGLAVNKKYRTATGQVMIVF